VYKYYNAKKGEKLGEIADRYNVDRATIQKWNNIKSDKLRKATKLKIYSSTQVQKAEVSSTKDTKASVLATTGNTLSEQDRNAEQHIVSKGEKLYQVAIRYGLTTSSIKKLNNLASSKISEGQVLILEKDKEAIDSNLETGKKSNAEPNPILIVNQPVKEYTVKKGDRLFSIAKSYGLSISQLKELNHLNSDILKFGQVLRVSCSNETDCVSENQLDSTLKVNSLAETQKAEKKIQKHVFKEAKSKHVEISKMYLVQKGDTLYSITKKFTKLTIKDLMRINNLKNKNIKPGQQLIVG
jgi:LysM repeat protein